MWSLFCRVHAQLYSGLMLLTMVPWEFTMHGCMTQACDVLPESCMGNVQHAQDLRGGWHAGQEGPLSKDEIKQGHARGQLHMGTLFWAVGMAQPLPLCDIRELRWLVASRSGGLTPHVCLYSCLWKTAWLGSPPAGHSQLAHNRSRIHDLECRALQRQAGLILTPRQQLSNVF